MSIAVSETILVVDDDPAVLKLVQAILSRQGYTILLADSGAKALDICQRQGAAIDLLLTDVMMPGMTGLALVRRLRASRQEIPVLFMTGSAIEIPVDADLDRDPEVLRKPFDPPALLSSIRNLLGAGHYQSAPL